MVHIKVLVFAALIFVTTSGAEAQRVLMLHSPGKEKHYFYKVGDRLEVQTGTPSFKLSGSIIQISDTFCLLDNKLPVVYSNVYKVYRQRAFFRIFSAKKLFYSSLLYSGISVTNHALHEEPLFDASIPIVSGTGLIAAFLSYKLNKKSLKAPVWKFKVLDL